MTTPDKLTLERLAALDEAQGYAVWDAVALAAVLRFTNKNSGPWDEAGGDWPSERDAAFICAAKGAAPRLLAALLRLSNDWCTRAKPNSPYDEGVRDGFTRAARDLDHLIRAHDLAREGE